MRTVLNGILLPIFGLGSASFAGLYILCPVENILVTLDAAWERGVLNFAVASYG